MTTLVETGYLPKFWELLVILGVSGLVVLLGVIVQRRVAGGPGLPLPFPVALGLFCAMLLSFCGLFYIFVLASPMQSRAAIEAAYTDPMDYTKSEPVQNRQIFLLLWSFVIYVPVIFYFKNLVQNSYATRIVDRIGPLSARIEDPSEFASARKLALRGDVDGAVAMYKSYRDNACEALFEAARLLKGEDRCAEAASVFQEITERFQERRSAWAEATYHLAKIHELNLRDISAAAAMYKSILTRTPESRYSPQAQTDLSRIQNDNEEIGVELVDTPKAGAERDPFFGRGRAVPPKPVPTKPEPVKRNPKRVSLGAGSNGSASDGADEVPPTDPFVGLREKQRAAALVAAAASKSAAAPAKAPEKKTVAKAVEKKPAAAKKPASAKPAVAKAATAKPATAKPAAKKPAAKKKPSA